MTSEARERVLAEDSAQGAAVLATDAEQRPDHERAAEDVPVQADEATEETAPEPEDEATGPEPSPDATEEEPAKRRRRRRKRAAAADADEDADDAAEPEDDEDDLDRGRRSRAAVPLVPVLAVLLVLLLAAGGWLWFTRPKPSSVHAADYVGVLQAARSEIVDLTSFDYLTLDDNIAAAKRITTGDLQKETLDRLNKTRKDVTDAQAVVSTEVVGAAVTRADSENGTVVLFIQSTQKNNTVSQAQVVQFYIEATLTKVGGRWLLSGITGR